MPYFELVKGNQRERFKVVGAVRIKRRYHGEQPFEVHPCLVRQPAISELEKYSGWNIEKIGSDDNGTVIGGDLIASEGLRFVLSEIEILPVM